jgi:hypothetical protein
VRYDDAEQVATVLPPGASQSDIQSALSQKFGDAGTLNGVEFFAAVDDSGC